MGTTFKFLNGLVTARHCITDHDSYAIQGYDAGLLNSSKIYVSKIDGNRKHIKLEIYFKIGEPIILEGKLNNKEKQEYIIDNERYLSKNNNTYYCSRFRK